VHRSGLGRCRSQASGLLKYAGRREAFGVKVIMVIAGLIALGALADVFDTDELVERRFDVILVVVAALAFGFAALVERARSRSTRGD
jgi:hypothetical protein